MERTTLLRALTLVVPICLFAGSLVLFSKARTVCTVLMVLGSACLLLIVLTHVPEALRSWTHVLSVVGMTTFSVAFLFHSLLRG